LPLAEGVFTSSGAREEGVGMTEVEGRRALMTKAEPVSRWQERQWQQWVMRGGVRRV